MAIDLTSYCNLSLLILFFFILVESTDGLPTSTGWAAASVHAAVIFILILLPAAIFTNAWYCLVLRSFLRIIRFKLHSKRRNRITRTVKYHGNCESALDFASLCSFCALLYLCRRLFASLLAIDIDQLLNFLVDYMCTLPQLIRKNGRVQGKRSKQLKSNAG